MMWEYCRFCNLTGYCENQNMGRECNSGVKKLYEENQQLKELLKRCRDFINYEVPDHCIDDVLLDKITNVIGENK